MRALALFATIVVSCCSWAQDYPRLELSAGYSYGSVDTQGYGTQRNAQGWSGSLTANVKRWVGVESEVSSRFQTQDFTFQGNSLSVASRDYTFLFGPRFAHRKGKATPFVHGLFGLSRSLSYDSTVIDALTGTSVTPYVNGVGAVAGGGFDYAISRRLAFRSQADYFFTRQASLLTPTPNNFRVLAAIVFTFGQSESPYARQRTNAPVVASAPKPVEAAPVEPASTPSSAMPAANALLGNVEVAAPVAIAATPAVEPRMMPTSIVSTHTNELTAKVQPAASKPVEVVVAKQ